MVANQERDTMNIFAVNQDPKKSAEILFELDPVRARKQIVELAQMLACLYKGDLLKKDFTPYKTPKAILNHPATKWLATSVANSSWSIEFMFWLISEATGGKEHTHGCYNAYLDLQDSPLSDVSRLEYWRWEDVTFTWVSRKCPQLCEDIFQAHILYIKLKQQGFYGN
jgi:hypothetical protein